MKANNDTDVKNKFLKSSSVDDLYHFFEYFHSLKPEPTPKGFEKKDLFYILFNEKKKYKTYNIPKKTKGEVRVIEAPTPKLKIIQTLLKDCIELFFVAKPPVHGFVKERSIVTNAKCHVRRKYIYTIDLEDFFPTIHFGRVQGLFRNHPFCFSPEIARHLANICCNDNGVLPQGAPTSPIIANLICRLLDGKLISFAKMNKIRYTRYADDLTFSSSENSFSEPLKLKIKEIIESENFKINLAKERLQSNSQRQSVTGLTVNKKVNVSRKYVKDLRFLLSMYKKGRDVAQNWLEKNYQNRHRYDGKVPAIERVLDGKIMFLKMVVGESRPLYISIYKNYNELIKGYDQSTSIDKKNEQTKQIQDLENRLENLLAIGEPEKLVVAKMTILRAKKESYLKSVVDKYESKVKEKTSILVKLKSNREEPFSKINRFYKSDLKTNLNASNKHSVNPQFTSQFLNRFREDSALKDLVHDNESSYRSVVTEAKKVMEKFSKSNRQFNVPTSMYSLINTFIGSLQEDSLMTNWGEKPHTEALKNTKINDYRQDFQYCYRFSSEPTYLKMSDIILYHSNEEAPSTWYLDIDIEKVDSDFDNVLSDTFRISSAIKLIFTTFEKYSQVGYIRIHTERKYNKVSLIISNVGIFPDDKTVNEFKNNNIGGTTKTISKYLEGYCEFSYISKFKNKEGLKTSKISILPAINEEPNDYDNVDGFIYQLVFYKPLKILIIDDAATGKRAKKAKNIVTTLSMDHYIYVVDDKSLGSRKDEISFYSSIFIHASYNEDDKAEILKTSLPKIFFGGDKNYAQKETSYYMSDTDFYDHLEEYLQTVKDNLDLSFDFWEQKLGSNQNHQTPIITHVQESVADINNENFSIDLLVDQIWNGQIGLNDNKVIRLLKDNFGCSDVPNFSSIMQLKNFVKNINHHHE